MAAQKALVLPEDAAASSEPQVFPGFPGVFVPGEPVVVESLGLSATEARRLVKELNLPLKETGSKPPKRELPPVAGEHYDDKELEPGDPVPLLDNAAQIASAVEGGEPLPPGLAVAVPLEAEEIEAAAEAATPAEDTKT